MRDYDFGNFIRESRELRGLSQYQLGALVGVSDKAVSKWENGVSKPQSRILGALSRALGITVDELLACELRSQKNEKGVFAMKKELWDKAYQKMEEIFGGAPPAFAVDRLESERAELEGTDMIVHFGLLAHISEAARAAGTRFRALGHTGAFYTAYLLGASEVDPLPPYYHCPACHKTALADGISDCWDAPPMICSCGEKLRRDGHNIPFETYRYVIGSHIRYGGQVAVSFFCEAVKTVREYFSGCGVLRVIREDRSENATFLILPPDHPRSKDETISYDEYGKIYHEHASVTIIASEELELYRRLEAETVTSFDRIPYCGADVLDAFRRLDLCGIPEFDGGFMKELLCDLIPSCFSNLIKAPGLSHGTGVWDGNARERLRGGCEHDQIIAYRDDVYLYMLEKTQKHGIGSSGIAYRIMCDTYRGIIAKEGIDPKTSRILAELGVEDWFSESIGKMRYLFPKAHGVVFTKYALIMMWYKLHCPAEFEIVMHGAT